MNESPTNKPGKLKDEPLLKEEAKLKEEEAKLKEENARNDAEEISLGVL